jgi:hypothetical protein
MPLRLVLVVTYNGELAVQTVYFDNDSINFPIHCDVMLKKK